VSLEGSVVHILVVHPGRYSEPGGALDPGLVACTSSLERLGSGVQWEHVRDAERALALCVERRFDLVVADAARGAVCEAILAGIDAGGPPVIVVGEGLSDECALEMFRRGAADCVTLKPDDVEALPIAALEQIERAREVRQRGAAERRIRDLERYTENIIRNMNSALLVVDPDGRITYCNAPAGAILGEDARALRGREVWRWFGGDSATILSQTLANGSSTKGAEQVITREDGVVIPIGISCAPFVDAEGARIGAIAIFQDLSEVKQLQSQVLQTEKMASIGQLAAGVAHEINNPMGFVHANLAQMAEYLADVRSVWERVAELLQSVESQDLATIRKSADALADHVREVDLAYVISDFGKAIRESQEGSERIRHIVQDLREFSHSETGERVLADVNQCLDSTATIVWPMMKQIVNLEKDYEDLDPIACFPMQVKQVFMNLLVNAYQSIESAVGESGEMGTIWLRTRQRSDGVAVEVTDTGVGILEANLDRIFDPFFTTKKVGSGTGLGLSTSFGIVQRHGGRMTVESKLGVGTTFSLFLPTGEDAGGLGGFGGG